MSQPGGQFHPEYEHLRREFNDFRYYLPDALLEIDLASLQVLYLNRQAELLLSFTARDVDAGLNGSALMAPEEFAKALAQLQEYIGESRSSGTPYTRSGSQDIFQQLRRKDGTKFLAESQTSFVLDDRGVPVRMLTIVRDISHRA